MLRKPTASVIFFHGSGDTGTGILNWITELLGRQFNGAHINYVYPTAPLQKYTPFNDEISTVWFNRKSVDIASEEDIESLKQGYQIGRELIENEVRNGIALQRIILGGFSMGGALAMHLGYNQFREVAGVFVHSGFLNRHSWVYDTMKDNTSVDYPELCMFHGLDDLVVKYQWGQETYESLLKLGAKGTFTSLDNTAHELQQSSLLDIEKWILNRLPTTT